MTPTPVGMRCPECARQRTPVRTIASLAGEPTVTYILIGLNVAAFLAEAVSGGGLGGLSNNVGGTIYLHGALYGPLIAHQHEYWRLVTGGFLHANLIHIGFNMYLLYLLGQMIEPTLGHLRFAALYLAALLAGSFGALLVSPDVPTVGASGAVFGLMGAAVVLMRARGINPMESGIGMLILFNLAITFVVGGISIGGHIGGLIGGLIAGYAIDIGQRRRSDVLALGGCALIAVAAAAGGIAVAGGSGL
jgi:membrane associated rhomboid family serine protease